MELFSNLKVIDLSTVLAGPSVGSFFAELGAEVLKIENKKNPDVTRSWKLPSEDIHAPISAYFSSVNYKKKYISLDLTNEQDHQTFSDLIADADLLISNFKFGDEAKLKITDEVLRQLNPGLIIGKINGFGEESDRVAYDLILQAETGFMSMNGTSESGPVKMPVALIDVLAAHHLKEGLLVALLHKKEHGIGRTVTVSLYDAAVSSLVNQASNYLMEGHVPKRIGSLHPNIAPYGELFTTKNGDQITFAIGSDSHFRKLCHFLSLDFLTDDIRFSSNQERVIHRTVLQALIQEKVALFDSSEILKALLGENVPVGKIKTLDEVFIDQRVRNLIVQEEIDGENTSRVSGIAFKL